MLRRKRDIQNGSTVVVDYTLSIKAAAFMGLLLGCALALAGAMVYIKVNAGTAELQLDPASFAQLKNELIQAKERLKSADLSHQTELSAQQSCSLVLEAMRRQDMMKLQAQLETFPAFKSDTYKVPFDKLKESINTMAQPIQLDIVKQSVGTDCILKRPARV